MNEEKINSIVNKSYYNAEYAKEYYNKNKDKIIERAKKRWAELSDKEKEEYYEGRKRKRRLKKESRKSHT